MSWLTWRALVAIWCAGLLAGCAVATGPATAYRRQRGGGRGLGQTRPSHRF